VQRDSKTTKIYNCKAAKNWGMFRRPKNNDKMKSIDAKNCPQIFGIGAHASYCGFEISP
jgi:hypothetical protein